MAREVTNWIDAANDAYSHLNEKSRGYGTKQMLAVIDDLCVRGTAAKVEMQARHGKKDFIETTLGHVTTAVHGPGTVPKIGGWYDPYNDPAAYIVDTDFAAAWRKKRRLPTDD